MGYEALPLRLDDHRDALAALWRENMSDARIADVVSERMRWLYERNPAGPALTWLAVVSGSEQVIGCGSLLPRPMFVNGGIVSGGLLADFAVTEAHRFAGAALTIQRAVANGSSPAGVQFLYGYPNASAIAVFKRLGYQLVGESSRWVKPLRSSCQIRRCTNNHAIVHATSAVINAGLAAADRALALLRGSYDMIELSRADARFDDLWQRARTSFRIVGEKSAAYLNWRYAEFTTRKHHFLCCIDRATGVLRGYIVYAVRGDGSATVEDLFGEDLDGVVETLLLRLSERLRRQGVSSLSCAYLGPETFSRHLKAVGFVPRPEARTTIAFVRTEAPADLRRTVYDKNAWLMIDGELDI